MAIDREFLKSIPYFTGIEPEELDAVERITTEKTVERGGMIIYEGDPAASLFVVYSGAVKIFKTSAEGKEQIFRIARPGDTFNDVPIFDSGNNPTSAQAMGPVVLYELKKNDVDALLNTHCNIVHNTIRVLAKRVDQMGQLIEDLSFRHVIGRVARILLEYAEDGAPEPRLTQQDMAAMAGTAREVVGRSLKTLEDEGLIKLNRSRIVINDKEALRERMESAF
jgi:CRP/FNR family transcriptional regulator